MHVVKYWAAIKLNSDILVEETGILIDSFNFLLDLILDIALHFIEKLELVLCQLANLVHLFLSHSFFIFHMRL